MADTIQVDIVSAEGQIFSGPAREVFAPASEGEVGLLPRGEPTAKIVRAIVRGLDRRTAFLLPSWRAWAVVTLAHWLPMPFDWIMAHWAPGAYLKRLADPNSR